METTMFTCLILQVASLAIYIIASGFHFSTFKFENHKLSIIGMIFLALAQLVGISAIFFMKPMTIAIWIFYLLFSGIMWINMLNRYKYLKS